jgi:hypothetical protein
MSQITRPETSDEHYVEPNAGTSEQAGSGDNGGGRKDRGRLHAVRSSAMYRGLLESLRRFGENPKALRRMEAELRAALGPIGPVGNLLFARFWSAVLRLILVERLEQAELATKGSSSKCSIPVPSLRESSIPILVLPPEHGNSPSDPGASESLEPELFSRLALIARYDRAASREMYRTLGLLLLMRSRGEKGLADAIRAAAGIRLDD